MSNFSASVYRHQTFFTTGVILFPWTTMLKLSAREWAGSTDIARIFLFGWILFKYKAAAAAEVVLPLPPLPPKIISLRSGLDSELSLPHCVCPISSVRI